MNSVVLLPFFLRFLMKIGSFYEFFDMIFTLLTKYCLFSVHIEPIPLCHRFSYDFSVLWLIAFTTYFQQIHPFSNVSAVQFFFDGVGNKISFIYLFHFFFSQVNILAETAAVC